MIIRKSFDLCQYKIVKKQFNNGLQNEIKQAITKKIETNQLDQEEQGQDSLRLIRKNNIQMGSLQDIDFSNNKEMGFFVKGMSPISYLSNGDLDEIVGYSKSILKDSTKEDNSSRDLFENKSSRKVKFEKLIRTNKKNKRQKSVQLQRCKCLKRSFDHTYCDKNETKNIIYLQIIKSYFIKTESMGCAHQYNSQKQQLLIQSSGVSSVPKIINNTIKAMPMMSSRQIEIPEKQVDSNSFTKPHVDPPKPLDIQMPIEQETQCEMLRSILISRTNKNRDSSLKRIKTYKRVQFEKKAYKTKKSKSNTRNQMIFLSQQWKESQ
ncbi:hypothetical protein pb186bvf_002801 [Paramecium bursaria]